MVKVTFDYEPDEGADDEDPTGLTEEEHDRLVDQLAMQFGATNIVIERGA
jgi:hypothetical protein